MFAGAARIILRMPKLGGADDMAVHALSIVVANVWEYDGDGVLECDGAVQ